MVSISRFQLLFWKSHHFLSGISLVSACFTLNQPWLLSLVPPPLKATRHTHCLADCLLSYHRSIFQPCPDKVSGFFLFFLKTFQCLGPTPVWTYCATSLLTLSLSASGPFMFWFCCLNCWHNCDCLAEDIGLWLCYVLCVSAFICIWACTPSILWPHGRRQHWRKPSSPHTCCSILERLPHPVSVFLIKPFKTLPVFQTGQLSQNLRLMVSSSLVVVF